MEHTEKWLQEQEMSSNVHELPPTAAQYDSDRNYRLDCSSVSLDLCTTLKVKKIVTLKNLQKQSKKLAEMWTKMVR